MQVVSRSERTVRPPGSHCSSERGNTQVAGFRECDRRFHRFSIPYFADEDHVRGLSQRVLQRVLEVHGVESDLALRDDRLFVLMDKLDRILHRDDMALMGRIPIVDHGGQRGGFIAPPTSTGPRLVIAISWMMGGS